MEVGDGGVDALSDEIVFLKREGRSIFGEESSEALVG